MFRRSGFRTLWHVHLLPGLARRHRNFFVAYAGLAWFHLLFGVSYLVDPGRYDVAFIERANRYIPSWAWGWSGVAIWAAMTVAVYREWWMAAKLAIGVGMFFALSRAAMIEASGGANGAAGLTWLFIALIHFVQMAEPPERVLYAPEHR